MYIRRKIFSLLYNENGEERYFSTTDITLEGAEERTFSITEEQREFGARKRKQNRQLARSVHNTEMHANKAAKAQEKASKIVSNPLNLVDEKKMEEAQKLTQKAQKSVKASQHAAGQAAQQTKNIAKTRTSVSSSGGLEIKNQGAGDMNIRKEGNNITVHKKSPSKSGQTSVTAKVGKPAASKLNAPIKSEVIVNKVTEKGGPKRITTEAVKKSAEKTQEVAEVAQETTKRSKQLLGQAKKVMNTKAGRIAGGIALAGGAALGAKKLYDKKNK